MIKFIAKVALALIIATTSLGVGTAQAQQCRQATVCPQPGGGVTITPSTGKASKPAAKPAKGAVVRAPARATLSTKRARITGEGWMIRQGFNSCRHILVSDCLPKCANKVGVALCYARFRECQATGTWQTDTAGWIRFR